MTLREDNNAWLAKYRFDSTSFDLVVEQVAELAAEYGDCGTHQLTVKLKLDRGALRALRALRATLLALPLDPIED